jgi:hypothetical protein
LREEEVRRRGREEGKRRGREERCIPSPNHLERKSQPRADPKSKPNNNNNSSRRWSSSEWTYSCRKVDRLISNNCKIGNSEKVDRPGPSSNSTVRYGRKS